jgi:hypothetical protein
MRESSGWSKNAIARTPRTRTLVIRGERNRARRPAGHWANRAVKARPELGRVSVARRARSRQAPAHRRGPSLVRHRRCSAAAWSTCSNRRPYPFVQTVSVHMWKPLPCGVRLCASTVAVLALTSCGGSHDGTAVRAPHLSRAVAIPNGIETFGRRASPAQAAAVSAVLRSYLHAAAGDAGAVACALLSAPFRSEVVGLLSARAPRGAHSCSQILDTQFARQNSNPRVRQGRISIAEVRVEGPRAFALLRQPGGGLAFYPLSQEGASWKLTALAPTTLPTAVSQR